MIRGLAAAVVRCACASAIAQRPSPMRRDARSRFRSGSGARTPPGRICVPLDVPFGWFDAPPSLNRLLGVQWLVRILHPRLFAEPLGPRVADFHTRYCHRTPTDAQLRALLAQAGIAR